MTVTLSTEVSFLEIKYFSSNVIEKKIPLGKLHGSYTGKGIQKVALYLNMKSLIPSAVKCYNMLHLC